MDQAYLIAGSQSYTGATTNWGTYGFKHRLKTDGSGVPRITVDGHNGEFFCIENGGNVGIGTSDPGCEFEVNGDMGIGRVAGAYTFREVVGGNERAGVHSDVGNSLIFKTGGATEYMRISSSGLVGIGTSAATNKLEIGGITNASQGGIMIQDPSAPTYGAYFHYDDANTQVKIGGVTAGAYNSTIVIPRDNNRVGIGRTPATNALEVNGNASKTAAGDWLANSDARLKKDIKQMDSQTVLDKMLALKGVTYYWNDTVTGSKRPTQLQYGFTAQNIQEVFPILVEEDNLGYLQTAYGTYDAMYVESMRALQEQIDSQQMIIEAQKAEIATEKVENESQQEEIESLKTETTKKLAALEAKLNALLLLNSKGAVLTAEN